MRRIVLIIVLVAVVGFAGYMLLRPRGPAGKARPAAADSTDPVAAKPVKGAAKSTGKTAGRLKATTKEQLKAEKDKRRKEEKQRKKELRRQERERRSRLKAARRGKGSRSKRGRKGGQLYVVSAIISLGDESYALIDGRRVGVGDVVMGRRIVAVLPDRLEVEAFGKLTTVRVGESLLPSRYYEKRRRG